MKSYCGPLFTIAVVILVSACTRPADSREPERSDAVSADGPSPAAASAPAVNADAPPVGEEVAIAAAEEPAEAPEPAAAKVTDDGTIYAGVYTSGQARRGLEVQENECSSCHTSDDWTGGRLIMNFTGQSAFDFIEHIRTTMPLDGPGRLSDQQYVDVAALILQLNGVPAGARELPTDASELSEIRMVFRR